MDNEQPLPNFCVNCKWIGTNASQAWEKYVCFEPRNIEGYNLVTGRPLHVHATCADARDYIGEHGCGEAGTWFEAKPGTQPYTLSEVTTDNGIPQAASLDAFERKPVSSAVQAKIDAARARVGKRIDANKIVEL